MLEDSKPKSEDKDEEANAILIPQVTKSEVASASYCIKTAQETSASLWRMWLICGSFLLPNFSCGLAMTFSVTGLPHFQVPELVETSKVHLDEDQGSWFVSVTSICMMTGILCGGCITEKFGCVWGLRTSLSLQMAGWILVFWAQSFPQLILGRVLTGFGAGLNTPADYMILTDLSLIRFRGIVAVLNSSANNMGWLVGLILGKFLPLKLLILTYSIPAAIFLLISPMLPESPLWLTKQGQDENAKKALEAVRGPEYPTQVEAKELLACVESARHNSSEQTSGLKGVRRQIQYYSRTREFLQPLGILLFMSVVQGCCGCDTISYYSLKIFRMAKLPIDEYLMAIFLQMGYTSGYLLISPFMEKINRKHLFITASALMVLALSLLATFMPNSGQQEDTDPSLLPLHVQVILPLAVIMFSLFYGSGFGPAIYTWSSELLPPRGRTVGCSISFSVRHIVVAGILKIYPWMLHSLGLAHLFSLHALALVIGIIFASIFIPETRGLSMSQLAMLFGGKLHHSTAASSIMA